MAMYLIGDIQGCDEALGRLLDTLAFSPSRDHLVALGDLVNRGPASAAVLRRLRGMGAAARCILGNHDLHTLAVAHGVRAMGKGDTLDDMLRAPDAPAQLEWLAQQPLALCETLGNNTLLMVHAGVLPAWKAIKTIALAQEVHTAMQADLPGFLRTMYGNSPTYWSEDLQGPERLRVVVNALTRMRFCTPQGVMDFAVKEAASAAPPGLVPWFDAPERQTASVMVAFGHWSTLPWLGRQDVFAMDSGCVWGGCLSALRVELGASGTLQTERIQVRCPQAQVPG
jgi:bis(5'-nucleosyl)-tetraphosphatase (symmetrical)